MIRSPGTDPEDLAMREHARELGPARRGRARDPWADAATVEIVEHWPCARGCGAMVAITREAADAFAIFNERLAATKQRLISKMNAVPCDACKREEDVARAAERRRQREQRTPDPGPRPKYARRQAAQ